MAPAFVHKRIAEYADAIAARAEQCARSLRDGATIDIAAVMMRLTLDVVAKTLFDADVGAEAKEIGDALTIALEHVIASVSSVVPIPPSVPTPGNLRNRRAVARLDETVYRIIRERRASKRDAGDFLSMLLLAQDEDSGSVMTDKQVRDEAMTIFLAGHETTANALAWAIHLLSAHPRERARLEQEARSVLGGRAPKLTDLPNLPYALQVFKEAMRLYPPVYVVSRRATRDVTIGGHAIRKGEIVVVNIAGMHRRAEYFADPHAFVPDRFSIEGEKAMNRRAYIPFGGGPRICIGNHFALMEGQIVLASLAGQVRFELVPGRDRVEPEPLLTLRPKDGVVVRVRRHGDARALGLHPESSA
jgi:cytochrome P450